MQIIIQRLGRGLISFGLVAAKTKPLSRKSLGNPWRTTIIPRRIDRCPECDSEKIVFPEAGAGTARTDLGESIGAVPAVAALGSRGLLGSGHERREATRNRLTCTSGLSDNVEITLTQVTFISRMRLL
jgi:hypothetical protein